MVRFSKRVLVCVMAVATLGLVEIVGNPTPASAATTCGAGYVRKDYADLKVSYKAQYVRVELWAKKGATTNFWCARTLHLAPITGKVYKTTARICALTSCDTLTQTTASPVVRKSNRTCVHADGWIMVGSTKRYNYTRMGPRAKGEWCKSDIR